MSDRIELPPSLGPAFGRVLAGLPIAAAGVLMLLRADFEWVGGAFLLAVGLPLFVGGVRVLVFKPPRLRATDAGVWFGGRHVVPWTAIKAVYGTSLDVRYSGARARTQSIAFEFHRRRTLLRLPPSAWFASALSVGDVDVGATGQARERPRRGLEAMRARVVGHEDGIVAGTESLPAARIIEKR